MFPKRFFSGGSRNVSCIGFFTNELLFNRDIIFGFQGFGMACKITVGYAQQFFKHIEIGTFVDHQYGHNPQTNSVIKGFIDILDDGFQG